MESTPKEEIPLKQSSLKTLYTNFTEPIRKRDFHFFLIPSNRRHRRNVTFTLMYRQNNVQTVC